MKFYNWLLLIFCAGLLFVVQIKAQDDKEDDKAPEDGGKDDDEDFPDFGEPESKPDPPTRKPLKKGPCDNRYHDSDICDEWAYGDHCEYNVWMKVHCASSCNSCDAREEGSCPNDYNDRDCDIWAHAGHCEQPYSAPFMKFQCAKACNSCDHRAKENERLNPKEEEVVKEEREDKPPPNGEEKIGDFDEP